MAVSRGKNFEENIKKTLQQNIKNTIERLHDQTTGYKNSDNPSDFILYRDGLLYYLECKSIKGASISKNNLVQLDRLLDRTLNKPNVYGIFIIWFVDKKETFWVDCEVVQDILSDKKSINHDYLMYLSTHTDGVELIPASYPRINGKYDFEPILSQRSYVCLN